MSVISAALQQAYASNPLDDVIVTVELNHASFASVVRLVTGQDTDLTATLEADAPFDPSTAVVFSAMAFNILPPGHDDHGPTPARVQIDNVSGQIAALMRMAITGNDPVQVIYREYTASSLAAPGLVVRDLKLKNVTLTATSASGEVGYDDVQTQAYPRQTYDKGRFPALFVQ